MCGHGDVYRQAGDAMTEISAFARKYGPMAGFADEIIREFVEAVAAKYKPTRFAEDDAFVEAHKNGMEAVINGLLREAGIGDKDNGKTL